MRLNLFFCSLWASVTGEVLEIGHKKHNGISLKLSASFDVFALSTNRKQRFGHPESSFSTNANRKIDGLPSHGQGRPDPRMGSGPQPSHSNYKRTSWGIVPGIVPAGGPGMLTAGGQDPIYQISAYVQWNTNICEPQAAHMCTRLMKY